ncbi:DUF3027 domain-containing protein [Microbacterium terricola]|uniref:DUF3027 domain-containing protein n=1 Tax=Microbacterium terricola TaxID=344163 RepID=A0ABM8E0L0_9MICO|nr:DUF3027 domain-containing protein [Microbacterium terricola]UYK40954.1 DUF3027 domain-containing protein [Microbacterium terricola]BDV31291.1 hypothetical protein Microterr_19510 [Microbacterium terricola]
MNSTPEPDPVLVAARDLALAALSEVTPASSIGEPADYRVEDDGVVSLRFHNRLPGYPGWYWTVSLARVEDAEPSVLEVELLPGDGALLAPEWVPWAERLADYQAAQAAQAEADAVDGDDEGLADDELDDDELDDDDLDDLDAADFDQDGSPILHSGDVDGVDIDVLSDEPEDDVDEVDDAGFADDESEDDADDDDESEDSDDDDSDDEHSDDEEPEGDSADED